MTENIFGNNTHAADHQEADKKPGGGHTPTRDSLIHADIKAGETTVSVSIKGDGKTVLGLLATITSDVTISLTKNGIPGPIAAKSVIDAVTLGLKKADVKS